MPRCTSVEEIEKIAKRMEDLQKRLQTIEDLIPLASELLQLSERLNIPLNLYRDQIKRMVILNGLKDNAPHIEKDEISKLIIQALLKKKSSNISGITATVKSFRGKASRRIISERLSKLEELGIVECKTGQNNEKLYKLRTSSKENINQ